MKKATEIWAEYAHACAFKTAKSNAIQLCEAFFDGWPEEKLKVYPDNTSAVCKATADTGDGYLQISLFLDFQTAGTYRLFAAVRNDEKEYDFAVNGVATEVTRDNIHELMAFALKGEDIRTPKPM